MRYLEKLSRYEGSERVTIGVRNVVVDGEVQIVFSNHGGRLLQTEYIFSLWVHTSFLERKNAVAMYERSEIDGASKEHKDFFDPGFVLEIEYTAQHLSASGGELRHLELDELL